MDWREGRDTDFERLCDENYRRVYGFFRSRTRSSAEAEDLTQEVFLNAYRGSAGFRGEGSEQAWLFGVAKNVLRRHLRRRATGKRSAIVQSLDQVMDAEGERGALPLQPAAGNPSPEEAAASRFALGRTTQAMRKLPHRQRICIIMRSEGASYETIASTLELALGTVKVHIHRARQALRAALDADPRDDHA